MEIWAVYKIECNKNEFVGCFHNKQEIIQYVIEQFHKTICTLIDCDCSKKKERLYTFDGEPAYYAVRLP